MSGSLNIQFASGLPVSGAESAERELPEQPELSGDEVFFEMDGSDFVAMPGVSVLSIQEVFEPVELTQEAFLRRLREIGAQAEARGDRLMLELGVHYDPQESLRLSGVEPSEDDQEPTWDAVLATWDAWGQQSGRLGVRSGRGLYPWALQCEVAARMVARDCAELVLGLGPEALVTGDVVEMSYLSETQPARGTRYWAEGRVLIGDADERGQLDPNGLSATVQVIMTLQLVPSFETLRRSLLLD